MTPHQRQAIAQVQALSAQLVALTHAMAEEDDIKVWDELYEARATARRRLARIKREF